MKQRNPIAVLLLPFITLGIYGLVWQVKTKNELNSLGAKIPTAWLLIIPIVNIYWLWKYSEGIEQVTAGKTSGVLSFILLFLLGVIGAAILQNEFNHIGETASATPMSVPAASVPVAETPPTNPTPPPAPTV